MDWNHSLDNKPFRVTAGMSLKSHMMLYITDQCKDNLLRGIVLQTRAHVLNLPQ